MEVLLLRDVLANIVRQIADEDGSWKVKGFVDIDERVYSLTGDTKVLSKALELVLLPELISFFQREDFRVELADYQNQYPDISVIKRNRKVALDIKTTYIAPAKPNQVNGFTLGAFTGYFRNRSSTKNVKYPYGRYKKHIVLGLIYERNTEAKLPGVFELKRLREIMSAIKNIRYFVHEKWRVASDKPGSGNTKNIGSSKSVDELLNGRGLFTKLGPRYGKRIFDEYWQNYLAKDMARAAELSEPPFKDLEGYLAFRGYTELLERFSSARG